MLLLFLYVLHYRGFRLLYESGFVLFLKHLLGFYKLDDVPIERYFDKSLGIINALDMVRAEMPMAL